MLLHILSYGRTGQISKSVPIETSDGTLLYDRL
jgi:hypothetical protein